MKDARPKLCRFCQLICEGPYPDDKELITAWWFCKGCNAFYEVHFTGVLTRLIFDIDVDGATYGIRLLYASNETYVVQYPDKPNDTLVEIATFPYVIPHLTPQNVRAKLTTLLVFL